MNTTENKNIIQINDLVYDYIQDESGTTKRAIDHVSINIERGSFTAVIGQNGSGKSTLAKCMNALLLPTEGTVIVNGYDTKDEDHLWDVRQSAGMVFQNPDNQIVSSIVEDDVAFGPENLGIDPQEIRKTRGQRAGIGSDGEIQKESSAYAVGRTETENSHSGCRGNEAAVYHLRRANCNARSERKERYTAHNT